MKWLVRRSASGSEPSSNSLFPVFGGRQHLPSRGIALVPITIGIAVLRYRLYEIDRILSRTVSYTLLVALLAGVFFGSVTLLTRSFLPTATWSPRQPPCWWRASSTRCGEGLQAWVDRRSTARDTTPRW